MCDSSRMLGSQPGSFKHSPTITTWMAPSGDDTNAILLLLCKHMIAPTGE